jgi:hypothetical protein
MWQVVRFDTEISTSVGEFSVNFGGQRHPFPDDQSTLYFHSELDVRP